MSDGLKYHFGTISELESTLSELRGKLLTEASNLETAANNLMTAWEGNSGYDAFKAQKTKWDQEFGTSAGEAGSTIGTLDAMSQAVRDAGSRAQGADKSVESLFS
ncbi:hypothetical protein LTV02_26855 [Nocardia yamanashiensis]|uniref:WXG100 family type VII secretion target n=1 Tax=Nocardia yamanashiensis TaxID=209247 RepID=UPI001E3AF6B9|nr:hypothetical protein [Nocardia yamanashiensis]UGT39662.1 hypothetical protein LTV02_26855 [Nocardia yamanashiensis]